MTHRTKRLLALLLALLLCISLFPAAALAEDEETGTITIVDELTEGGAIAPADEPDALPPADETQEATSGYCGEDLTWTLDDDGTLTISGTGDMWDWDWNDGKRAPWSDHWQFIQNLVVEPGVTSIGNDAFSFLSALNSLDLPDSVERIGDSAFIGCGLCEFRVPSNVKVLSREVLSRSLNLRAVYLPSGLESIERFALAQCGFLKDVYYDGTIAAWTALFEQMQFDEEADFWAKIATIHCSDGEIVPQVQYCGANATWTLENGVLTISGTGSTWFMYGSAYGCWDTLHDQITSIVVEEGITGINRNSFCQLNQVTSVSLPQSLVSIGQGAFMRMSNLESLTLPEGLQVFEHEVFIGTGLRSISLPEGLTTLPQRTFQECRNLKTVELPSSIRTIEEGAFRWASALESIEIPAGVTSLADLTFDGCTSLHDVWFRGSAPDFTGCNFENTQTGTYTFRDVTATVHYPAGDPSWTEEVRQNYGGNITWEAYENVVTVLASGECGDDLTWTLTDDGVLTISGTGDMWNFAASDGGNTAVSTRGARGDQEEAPWAAYRDQICKVVVEEGVTSVGDNAFQACESLNEVVFEGDAPEISESAFAGVEATISYPEDNETWTEEVLQDYGGDLSWEPYQASPAVIASGQCGDDLTWTLDENGTLTITGTGDMWDFYWDLDLEQNTMPWYPQRLQILKLVLSEGVTGIGWEACSTCYYLKDVELPDTLVRIGGLAFQGCAFVEIHLPASLERIENGAFLGCINLKDVYYDGTVAQWQQLNIDSENEYLQKAAIHCTDGDVDNSDRCGDELTWSFDEESGTLTITGTGQMWGAPEPWDDWKEQIRKLELPEGLTGIGGKAFSGCTALTDVTLPSTLTSIDYAVFQNCDALTSVVIPASVSFIGGAAFSGCDSLAELTLSFGLECIYSQAFTQCPGLTSLEIPASVSFLGEYAFEGCTGLTEITFQGSPPDMQDGLFEGVTATAYYPSNLPGWTEDVLRDYGGTIIWTPYEKEATVIASGQCGDELTWTLDDIGTLTISGTGDMWDFEWDSGLQQYNAPWYPQKAQIRRLIVSEGVTGIGMEAFDNFYNMVDVELPNTLVRIGAYAFWSCAFTEIHLPASLERIEYGAFAECRNLKDVYYDGTVAQWRQLEIDSENEYLQKAAIHCSDGDVDNSDRCGDELTWSFDAGTGTLTITGTGQMWGAPEPWDDWKEQIRKLELPEGMTKIGGEAFSGCTALTDVTLPSTLTSIDYAAFANCDALTSVEIPASVSYIGWAAFSGCDSLAELTLSFGVRSIEGEAFARCPGLTSLEIPATVSFLGERAFGGCTGLTEITFQGSAPDMWDGLFEGVTATAYYPSNLSGWTEDVLWDYGGTITWTPYEKEATVIASGECGDELTWTLTDIGVLTISGTGDMWDFEWEENPWSYYANTITEIDLPDGLTSIGNCAFVYCSRLRSLEIPETVVRIGDSAFFNSNGISEILLPTGVTEIGWSAFSYCHGLQSVRIPASVYELGGYAFFGCLNLTEIWFEGSAPTIEENAFGNVNAEARYPSNYKNWTDDNRQDYGGTITWTAYEKEIGVMASGQCGDELTWTLADDYTMTISGAGDMWDYEYITSENDATPWVKYTRGIIGLTAEQGVTGIGNEAFDPGTRLTELQLPDTLVRIGNYAFESGAFTEIHLPASLELVQAGAFLECTNLTDVYYADTTARWEQIAIGTYNDPLTRAAIHCTDGDVDNSDKCGDHLTWSFDEATGTLTVSGTGKMWDYYSSSTPWEGLMDQIRKVVLEPGVTSVGASAFWGCPNLTEIVLPEGLTYLEQFCFRECPGLVTVDLPASLETMDQGEFSECPNLIAINAAPGGNYKTVDGVLFSADMKTLVEFPGGLGGVYQVPDGVTTLGPRAFYGCAKLTEIKLPASVVEFGWNEFQRCYNLEAVNIPYGVTILYVSTFWDCTSLKSLTIPASVTYITDYCFCNCTSLEEIRFEGSAPEIEWWGDGTGLFQDVTATAYYPGNDETWTKAFRSTLGSGGQITWVPFMPNPFADVPEGKYYYDPVLWAYYHDPQITGGTSETTFSPNKTCTREQIVTFLWKACGAPEPESTTNPFTDVKESKYYFKAVLWAVEKGITGGMSETLFGVGRPCTREQAMTFLWKACGAREPETTTNPFTDVPEGKYYYNAVLWAVEKGITGGVSATAFGVGKPCTRGQIVTFLYAARQFLNA